MDRSKSWTLSTSRSGRALGVVLVILVAATGTLTYLWYQSVPSTSARAGTEAEPSEKSAAKPMVEEWDPPAFVLAITGQMHGYIEPCGCSPKQSGGLARRSELIRQLREDRKWPVLGLETGGALDMKRVDRKQSMLKFGMIQDSLNSMGYKGLGLGTEELKLGALNLFTIHSNRNVEEGFELPFIAANVTLLGSPELGTPLPFKVYEVGGKKVAVTSTFGSTHHEQFASISPDDLKLEDVTKSLRAVLPKMKAAKPDLLVLMSYDDKEPSRELAQKFPELDVVVSAGGADDPGDENETIGKTLFFVTGMKGKYVNLVGIYPGKQPHFERVELDQDRFKRDPKIREMMAKYQQLLKEEWLTPTSDIRSFSFPHPSQREFVGVKTCQECHPSATKIWEESEHFNATRNLVDGRPEEKGEWIDRTWDPECLCCHSTGWDAEEAYPFTGGFIDAETTPHLTGNQCENCHGPASEHVKLEQEWKKSGGPVGEALAEARKSVRLKKEEAAKKACLKCHDFANSPHFDFETYWPQIEHPTPEAEKAGR